jgi:integrase
VSGSGTIQRLGPGEFRVWLSAGRADTGKRIRVSERVTGSYRDAQRRLAALKADLDSGRLIAQKAQTLAGFVESWWPSKSTSLSPTTARDQRRLLDVVILPAIGSRPLQRLTGAEIAAFLRVHIERGRVHRAASAYILLRHILRSAVKLGLIARSPLEGVPKPKPPYREMKIISGGDWQRALALLRERKSPWLTPFHVAITTGARRSEVAALRWQDFDPGKSTLRVQRAIHKLRPGEIIVREPKTARSRRTIALDGGTVSLLVEHRRESEHVAAMFGRKLRPTDYIFARTDGQPWPPDAYSRAWYRVTSELGLKGLRLHDLRHSAASLMLAAGVPVQLVAARLGHSSPAVTLNVYSHAVEGGDAAAAEKLAAMLNVDGGTRPALTGA